MPHCLIHRLESDIEHVRACVGEGLEMIAGKGHPIVVDFVSRRLGHPRGHVRHAAASALAMVRTIVVP